MAKRPAYIGASIPRVEDYRFLTGTGRYSDDHRIDQAAHCVFVRSQHAHARILRIDAASALNQTGVLAVLTGTDYRAAGFAPLDHAANPLDALDVKRRALLTHEGTPVREIAHWPLAIDRVRHVGDPVVAVIATSAALARDAAEHVVIDYEPLPAVVSPYAAAQSNAPQLHDDVAANQLFSVALGEPAAFNDATARAALVVRHRFTHPRIANAQMEPRGALGEFDPTTECYTLTSGSQGVSRPHAMLVAALRTSPDKVRVICPDVGGGFGPRSFLQTEQIVVLWAARRVGRAVQWTSDRSEALISDYQGRDSVMDGALALAADGRMLGYRLEMFGNIGAHAVSYVPIANVKNIATTCYDIPAVHLSLHGMLTNTVPTAPFRGAGRPEAHHVIERLIDMGARKLGIDRVALRRRNLIRRDQLPYRAASGLTYDAGDFHGYLDRALALADWSGFEQRRVAARARGRHAGIGVASYIETPVGAPRERAEVVIHPEGIVDLIVGTQSTGQGHETSFAQVLADRLGVTFESIRVRYGDTAFVKGGGGTHSDRSLRLVGTLLVQAADDIIAQGRAIAARELEVATGDLVYADGAYQVSGTDRSIPLFAVARLHADLRQALAAAADFIGRIPAYPAGAAVCELEVDPATGTVAITRYTSIDDVGRPVNPMILDGQTHGAITQGVGQALRETYVFDAHSGQVLSGTFMDYALTRADELPHFTTAFAEDPTYGNPLGIKGGGEGGIVPATAVIVNALCDALAIDDLAIPVTPERLWRALNKGSSNA